jgi:hypothetical protein
VPRKGCETDERSSARGVVGPLALAVVLGLALVVSGAVLSVRRTGGTRALVGTVGWGTCGTAALALIGAGSVSSLHVNKYASLTPDQARLSLVGALLCALGASGWAARCSQRDDPVIAEALLALSLVVVSVGLLLVLSGGTSC